MTVVLQDRVIFHRLENICHCIERGEWPGGHRYGGSLLTAADSHSSTPVPGTPTSTSLPMDSVNSASSALERLVRSFNVKFCVCILCAAKIRQCNEWVTEWEVRKTINWYSREFLWGLTERWMSRKTAVCGGRGLAVCIVQGMDDNVQQCRDGT